MTVTHHPGHLLDRVAMMGLRLMFSSVKGRIPSPSDRKSFDDLMERLTPASGVTYESAEIGSLSGWWCRPEDATPEAAIIYFHGGFYVIGSAYAYRHFVGQIAARAKVAAFIVEYGLAPERPFPVAVRNAQTAYQGLVDKGYARIVLAGDAAGGGLALVLLSLAVAKALETGGPRPEGAALISPWTDLALTGASMHTRAAVDPLSTEQELAAVARLYLGDHDPLDPTASPLYGELTGLPPVLIHIGENEVLLDDSVRIGERIEAAGGICEVHVWEGMIHFFPALYSILTAANEALDDIGNFLRARCGCGTGRR
jgi:acetyl esterase/lipase